MGDPESLMMLISTRLARSYGMVRTRARRAFPRRFQGRHPIVQSLGIVILLQYHTRVSTSKGIKAIPEIAVGDLERGYWLTSGSPCRTMIRHLIRHQKSSHRVGDLGRSLLVETLEGDHLPDYVISLQTQAPTPSQGEELNAIELEHILTSPYRGLPTRCLRVILFVKHERWSIITDHARV